MYFSIKLPIFLSSCSIVFLNINFFSFLLMTYFKPEQGLTIEYIILHYIEVVHSGVDVLSLNLQFFGNSFVVEWMYLCGANLHGVF
jgi:hypothetical protein